MANRTIELTLKARVDGLVNGLQTAKRAATDAGRDLESFRKKNEEAWNTAGTAAATGGAAILAGVGLVTKAAMDWETAWAGVNKTVDGTPEQMAALEAELRNLATTLPSTHTEIAAVAEAAGQLGIAREDVSEFTRTMIDLGETTNLTAEEAATSLAQFMNIMGTSANDIDNLGSSLVALGNDGASTEKDILDMATRVAAVGAQMGMTEADVMALSSAMASLGIEAEAGGTAISTVMKRIDAAVREGGESLTGWSEAASVSAEEFATAWREDPAQAMVILTQGLGATAAAGGDVNAMLSDLGVKGIREADTMLRLAQSGDLLAESFATGAESFSSASALADEAAKRYETAESRIAVSWNKIKDAAIDAGGAILPAVAGIAEAAGGIAEAFGALPDPVKGGLGVVGGVAGVAGVAAGGLALLTPRVAETVTAFRDLSRAAPGVASALGNIGKTAGVIGGVAVGMAALGTAIAGLNNEVQTMEELVIQMERTKLAGEGVRPALDGLFDISHDIVPTYGAIKDLGGALRAFNPQSSIDHMKSFEATVLNLPGSTKSAYEAMETLDKSMASIGSADAAEYVNKLRLEAEDLGYLDFSNWEGLTQRMPEYTDKILEAANATGVHVSEADLFQAAMGNLPPVMQAAADGADETGGAIEGMAGAAEQAAGDLDAMLEALQAMGLAERDARAASRDYQAAIDGVTESIKTNGTSLDENTEKGRANASALDAVAQAGLDSAVAMAENGASHEALSSQLTGTYDQLVTSAQQFGLNEEKADAYARSILGIPDDANVETYMDTRAQEIADQTAAAVEAIPGYKAVTVAVSEDGTVGSVQMKINAVTGKTEYVFVTDSGTITNVQQGIVNINGKDVTVWVDDNGTVYSTQGEIMAVKGKDVTIVANAATSGAEADLNHAARDRHARIIARVVGNTGISSGPGMLRRPGGATGGVVGRDFGLPKLSTGGFLPYTGLGTDKILGIGSDGVPTAWVDDGEAVTREEMARKYRGVLGMINADHPRVQHLAKYATGRASGAEWSASSAPSMSTFPSSVSATVDAAVIGEAVRSAIAGYRPVVSIGKRDFYGVMQEAQAYGGSR